MAGFDIGDGRFAGTDAVEKIAHVILTVVQTLAPLPEAAFRSVLVAGSQVAAVDPDPAVGAFEADPIALAGGVFDAAEDIVSLGGADVVNRRRWRR